MSIPLDTLTEEELEALHLHGFRRDGKPNQLGDAFINGMRYASRHLREDNKILQKTVDEYNEIRKALAEEPVVVKTLVLDLIDNLRATDPYIETIFTEGGCYQFHLWLKTQYPKAVALINPTEDHVITQIGEGFYDITGEVNSDGYIYTLDKHKGELESWSFAKNRLLSVGECQYCEEPILIPSGEGTVKGEVVRVTPSLFIVCFWWFIVSNLLFFGFVLSSLYSIFCGLLGTIFAIHYTVEYYKDYKERAYISQLTSKRGGKI